MLQAGSRPRQKSSCQLKCRLTLTKAYTVGSCMSWDTMPCVGCKRATSCWWDAKDLGLRSVKLFCLLVLRSKVTQRAIVSKESGSCGGEISYAQRSQSHCDERSFKPGLSIFLRNQLLLNLIRSEQFYFTEKDVGKNRAEVSAAQLQDLNPYVNIHVHSETLTTDVLSQFQVSRIFCREKLVQC